MEDVDVACEDGSSTMPTTNFAVSAGDALRMVRRLPFLCFEDDAGDGVDGGSKASTFTGGGDGGAFLTALLLPLLSFEDDGDDDGPTMSTRLSRF